MINNTTPNSNIFDMFPNYNLEMGVVPKTNYLAQKSIPVQDTVELKSTEEKKKTRRKILFGSSIASTILTAGIAGLLIFRGPHTSGLKSNLPKFKSRIKKELHDAGNEQMHNLSAKVSYASKKAQSAVASGLEASLNVNMHKDRFVDKIFHLTKATGKFADDCTETLRRVVDKTLGKKYKKVEGRVRDLSSVLKKCDIEDLKALDPSQLAKKITIKNETLTLGEWIARLEKQASRLDSTFDDAFTAGSVAKRGKKRRGLLSKLSKKVNERFSLKKPKSYIDPKNYTTYATEELSADAREQLSREILRARKEVTNDIGSISEHLKSSLGSFYDIVRPNDSKSRDAVVSLRKQLDAFRACSGDAEVQARAEICKTMISNIDELLSSLPNMTSYSAKEQKQMKRILETLKDDIISSSGSGSKGALEEIRTILKGLNAAKLEGTGKKIISDSRLKQFTKSSEKIKKGLTAATDLEMGEYFSKQAEMEMGSAVSDVVSLFLPIGAAGVAIAKGDNKDEKVSATLTTGIPLVGAFATAVYGTVKMFSGAKNVIFSLASGAILSAIGNYADKLYKNYRSSGSVVNVVKDEYNKIWTGLETQIHQFDEPVNAAKIAISETFADIAKEEKTQK